MTSKSWIAAAALSLALAPTAAMAQAAKAAPPADKPAAQAKPDDSKLKERIEARIESNASLKDNDIDVAVDGGVATLTGKVHSAAQKANAARLAKITGVTNVENKLEIDSATEKKMDTAAAKTDRAMDKAGDKTASAADKAGDKTASAAHKAGDAADHAGDKTAAAAKNAGEKTKDATGTAGQKTKDATGTAGQKTKDAASGAGEAVTDAWVTTKIKADFVNEAALKGSDINVDTNNHVVTLKGTVATAAGKARAAEVAKATKGVTSVVNNLTIAPK